jgi:hypothetical protein
MPFVNTVLAGCNALNIRDAWVIGVIDRCTMFIVNGCGRRS